MTLQPLDTRVCFVGDSFVAGIGDETGLGWPGRLVAREARVRSSITAYNLGIRRDTSSDIRARLQSEIARRHKPDSDSRLVLSFGVNDCMLEDGFPRVAASVSRENLIHFLRVTSAIPVLVVGPPPVDDDGHNERIAALSEDFRQICGEHGRPFVDLFPSLVDHTGWRQQVRAGDGAHPRAEGYATLFELVIPMWDRWMLATP